MRSLRRHLTYANVVATLALFLVVSGGAAYAATNLAKNSVGTKQIKKGAVTTAKIKNGAVTSAKIGKGAVTGANVNVSSLGTVPSATHAESAGNATHANSADNATHADSASSAGHADSAGDSSTLQGMTAAQVAATASLRCPEGTAVAAGLCFETSVRSQEGILEALSTCGKAGRLLPSMTELTTYLDVTHTSSVGEEWVGQVFYDAPSFKAIAISVGPGGSSTSAEPYGTPHHYRCAVLPTN